MAGQKAGLTTEMLAIEHPRLAEIPFDFKLRVMGCVCADGSETKLYVKGAYDMVVPHATRYMSSSGIEPLTASHVLEIEYVAKELASKGLRVFAVAYRLCEDKTYDTIRVDENLIFVGLLGMTDPIRAGVHEALITCRQAGIRTVMVTGDHPDTAYAIGKELGLLEPGLGVLTGSEVDTMSDQDLQRIVPTVAICARSSVEHKVRIVQAWQALGTIVATTGDGINDAPALKTADIGIAMGKSGTALAKEASDVILLDDNFASIVYAIAEGRGIFDSVRKNAGYIILTTVAELGVVCGGIMWGLADADGKHLFVLLPLHLLWLDLVTEFLMTTALIHDPLSADTMKRKPHEFTENLLPIRSCLFPACLGLVVTFGVLSIFYSDVTPGAATSKHLYTLSFTAMVLLGVIALQIVRLYYGISFYANKRVIASFIGIGLVQLALIYTPALARMFHLEPMTYHDWLFIGTMSLFVLGSGCIMLIIKKIFFTTNSVTAGVNDSSC